MWSWIIFYQRNLKGEMQQKQLDLAGGLWLMQIFVLNITALTISSVLVNAIHSWWIKTKCTGICTDHIHCCYQWSLYAWNWKNYSNGLAYGTKHLDIIWTSMPSIVMLCVMHSLLNYWMSHWSWSLKIIIFVQYLHLIQTNHSL